MVPEPHKSELTESSWKSRAQKAGASAWKNPKMYLVRFRAKQNAPKETRTLIGTQSAGGRLKQINIEQSIKPAESTVFSIFYRFQIVCMARLIDSNRSRKHVPKRPTSI